jgi:gas vesicle protein
VGISKKMKNKIIKGAAVGAGIAAVIAGTYFLYGSKNSTKNRKKVKSWMLQAKGEILERIENISEVSEDGYNKIVKEVADKYQALKKIDKRDITEFVEEIKSHWKDIEKRARASKK